MDRLSIGIMRLSEMRLTGSGQGVVNNHQIYHSGNLNPYEWSAGRVTNFILISEEVLFIQLNITPTSYRYIHTPIADKAYGIFEAFYNDLMNALRSLPKNDLTIL